MSNSRRSQMAQAIFEKLSGTRAESAGIDPAGSNHTIDNNVITSLREIGIETHNLKVKKLTEEMLENADKIIAFRCADKLPEKYKRKIEEWELGRKREVGEKQSERSVEEIREMRDSIYHKVTELVERLK
jgi:protein-tyrosine-phosphatase